VFFRFDGLIAEAKEDPVQTSTHSVLVRVWYLITGTSASSVHVLVIQELSASVSFGLYFNKFMLIDNFESVNFEVIFTSHIKIFQLILFFQI
jgi:hypothetical protein